MKHSQLKTVMDLSQLSPEVLAPKLGISNMTLRRWKTERGSKEVPQEYELNIIDGIYRLIIEGHLDAEAVSVKKLVAGASPRSFQAVIKNLGLSGDFSKHKIGQEEEMNQALYQIGASPKHKNKVEKSDSYLQKLKKMGIEWNHRITTLTKIIRSTEFKTADKFVAYGALFYLIAPIDLIPDHIPIIGFIDDFGVLGFAVAYYARKYPALTKGS